MAAPRRNRQPKHEANFGDKVAEYVDAGKSPIGKPSTIVKVIGGDYWLLRIGAIGVGELKAVAGKVAND